MPRVPPDGGRDYTVGFGPSGGPYIDSSAIVPTSGASGAGSGTIGVFEPSGPWYIEQQSLTVRYARVPRAGFKPAASAVGLSAIVVTENTWPIYDTNLIVSVDAHYSRVKTDAFFSTSSFIQPQKFEVVGASADVNGQTYGGSGTTSSMGPLGTIFTKQNWYFRRPWMTGDTQYTSSISNTYTYAALHKMGDTSGVRDAMELWADQMAFVRFPSEDGSFWAAWQTAPVNVLGGIGHMGGAYSINMETWNNVISTLDEMGYLIKGEKLWPAQPPLNKVLDPVGAWGGYIGIPEYETYRHDYI